MPLCPDTVRLQLLSAFCNRWLAGFFVDKKV